MHMFMYVNLHVCAGVCACGGQRSTLSVIIQEIPILFFQTESGTWGSWIRLGWLASNSWDSVCPHLPGTGATDD